MRAKVSIAPLSALRRVADRRAAASVAVGCRDVNVAHPGIVVIRVGAFTTCRVRGTTEGGTGAGQVRRDRGWGPLRRLPAGRAAGATGVEGRGGRESGISKGHAVDAH